MINHNIKHKTKKNIKKRGGKPTSSLPSAYTSYPIKVTSVEPYNENINAEEITKINSEIPFAEVEPPELKVFATTSRDSGLSLHNDNNMQEDELSRPNKIQKTMSSEYSENDIKTPTSKPVPFIPEIDFDMFMLNGTCMEGKSLSNMEICILKHIFVKDFLNLDYDSSSVKNNQPLNIHNEEDKIIINRIKQKLSRFCKLRESMYKLDENFDVNFPSLFISNLVVSMLEETSDRIMNMFYSTFDNMVSLTEEYRNHLLIILERDTRKPSTLTTVRNRILNCFHNLKEIFPEKILMERLGPVKIEQGGSSRVRTKRRKRYNKKTRYSKKFYKK
jgi:hypothetical protein